MKKLIRLL